MTSRSRLTILNAGSAANFQKTGWRKARTCSSIVFAVERPKPRAPWAAPHQSRSPLILPANSDVLFGPLAKSLELQITHAADVGLSIQNHLFRHALAAVTFVVGQKVDRGGRSGLDRDRVACASASSITSARVIGSTLMYPVAIFSFQ